MSRITRLAHDIAAEMWDYYETEFVLEQDRRDDNVEETARIIESTLDAARKDG